ncbi:branched-chain amino acid transport system II carrier protein, partial [Escherichia coli]|uniref:branched-chain amino acid transport system II carrier protein n=1 Tax=Escherichia coli TaxID=562 RepID=UPI00210BD894
MIKLDLLSAMLLEPVLPQLSCASLTLEKLHLVFGIVIVRAITSRGVTDRKLITKYAVNAAIISGIGLTLVYLSLFKLGLGSHDVAPNAANGAIILHA